MVTSNILAKLRQLRQIVANFHWNFNVKKPANCFRQPANALVSPLAASNRPHWIGFDELFPGKHSHLEKFWKASPIWWYQITDLKSRLRPILDRTKILDMIKNFDPITNFLEPGICLIKTWLLDAILMMTHSPISRLCLLKSLPRFLLSIDRYSIWSDRTYLGLGVADFNYSVHPKVCITDFNLKGVINNCQ